ncbi:hypothetical protein CRG98_034444 [Punica granatum]|uniref:Uncharacterized protein n=1 Tax=Punica granatum TaxID=22663 RepID=A0A2I0IP17_PUNGR|nr:hypothetical protein CRG98_034444 [Punica granatum]
MSMRTRSSKKKALASKQLAPSQSIKKEEKSSKQVATSQPSFGQITVDSQIKTYRQTLQQEIDKQGCMQTLPDKAQVDHQTFLQVKARASFFLSAAKTDEDYIGRLSQPQHPRASAHCFNTWIITGQKTFRLKGYAPHPAQSPEASHHYSSGTITDKKPFGSKAMPHIQRNLRKRPTTTPVVP